MDDPQLPPPNHRTSRRRFWSNWTWKAWGSLALALAVALAAGGYLFNHAAMEARLMRADPDAVVKDAALENFAIGEARGPYGRHCASCHGADLKGDVRRGIPNLTDHDWLYGEGRVAEIERTILYGIRAGNARTWNLANMPAFATAKPYFRYDMMSLTPGDIKDVTEFLLVTAGKDGDVAAAERGGAIFAEKGQCFDCHSPDGRGDAAIGAPDLLDDVWLYGTGTRQDIIRSISRGLSGACPAWYQNLDGLSIRALSVYINATARKSTPKTISQTTSPAPGRAG